MVTLRGPRNYRQGFVHTLLVCILLNVYRIHLFKQMTQVAHSRKYLKKGSFGYTELFDDVFVFCAND